MTQQTDQIKEILHGHTSMETAYVVEDYPYGFRLRCQIRYWLEYRKGHGTRLTTQTTNPKKGDIWNKPKSSTYSTGFAFLYLDENDHVKWNSLDYSYPVFELYEQVYGELWNLFTPEEQELIKKVEKLSRHYNPNTWNEYDAKKREAAAVTA